MLRKKKKRKSGIGTKVLALNRSMIPVDFKDARDAFRIACKGNAYFFDTMWRRYTLDEWIYEHVEKENGGLSLGEFNADMNTVKYEIPIPPVMVLEHYEAVTPIHVNLNRENIWKRDGACCAYCKKPLKLSEVTLDHVHPRAKGGKNSWMNLVASCQPCNNKKADELLNDIHDMELSVEPFAPTRTSILYRLSTTEIENMPDFWKHFFVEFK
jgi:5-methylcytosine-specific restriction endonuclease McrA